MLHLVLGLAALVNYQTWASQYNSGKQLYEQGRFTEAIGILQNVRADAKSAKASELDTALVLDTLGASYEAAGQLTDARESFDQALAIRRSHLHEPDELIAISLTNESSIYWAMVKPDEAVKFATAATHMWEDLGNTNRREYLVALNNLIMAEMLRGQVSELEPIVSKTRNLYEKELQRSDPMLPKSLSVLASAYKAIGRYGDADATAVEALDVAEQQHASAAAVAKIKLVLGSVRSLNGHLTEAEKLLIEGTSGPAGSLPSEVIERANAYRNLGSVERQLGKYDQAASADLQALNLLGDREGQAKVIRAEVLNELGILSEARNSWKEAERYVTEAAALMESAFGPGHSNLAPIYSDLGSVYMHARQYGKAESFYKRALAAEMSALPPEHPVIGRDLNNWGTVEFNRGHFDQAEQLFSKATAMLQHTLGSEHADTALVEANLADALFMRKQMKPSRDHFTHSLAVLDHCWGQDDPRLLPVLDRFEALLGATAEPAEAEKLDVRMERIRVKEVIRTERQQSAGTS